MRVFTEAELHEYLTDAIARVHAERGKGPITRGAVAALEGVIFGLQLKAGAQTHIIRGEQ
jgi:hypothetical protein